MAYDCKPAVQLAELWERESQAGKRYYSGFMGRTRVLLLHSGDREHKGETVQIWRLVVSETEPREGQPAARQSPTPPRASTSLGRAPAGLAAP